MNTASRIATVFFLVGATSIGFAFTKVEGAGLWFKMGGLAWVAAYFSVVIDNLMRKAPVQTRGGLARYEDGPLKYMLPYVFLFVFGILFLTIIVISMIAS